MIKFIIAALLVDLLVFILNVWTLLPCYFFTFYGQSIYHHTVIQICSDFINKLSIYLSVYFNFIYPTHYWSIFPFVYLSILFWNELQIRGNPSARQGWVIKTKKLTPKWLVGGRGVLWSLVPFRESTFSSISYPFIALFFMYPMYHSIYHISN